MSLQPLPLRSGLTSFTPDPKKSRREQVIDAAAHVFARQGYHGAGTRAIADLLGIKVASLYFHFRSKEEALEEVCHAGQEQPIRLLREACMAETSFEKRVHRFFADYGALLAHDSDNIQVFVNERRYLLPEAAFRLRTAARKSRVTFEQLFDDARKEGAMDPAMPSRMARLILIGNLRNITLLQLEEPFADMPKLVDFSAKHFLRGLGSGSVNPLFGV